MKLQKHTLEYLHKRQVSQNLIEQVEQLESAEMLDEAGFEQAIRKKLDALFEQHKKLIKDGARGLPIRLKQRHRW